MSKMAKVIEIFDPAVILTFTSTNLLDQMPPKDIDSTDIVPIDQLVTNQLLKNCDQAPKQLDLRPKGIKGLGFIKS